MADDIHSMDPQQANLLRRYAGAKPEAPDWFTEAVNTSYTEHFVTVQGAEITVDIDGGAMVDEAKVIQADIEAENGIIHVIDKVIMPGS